VGLERAWRRRRFVPALYDLAVEHERFAYHAGRVLWGADVRPVYDAFGAAALPAPGSAVLDVPCGGGVAFRGLAARHDLRYVGADLSAPMLARARRQARRRGLDVALVRASAGRLPFASETFDVCVTYNGLHCFADPGTALAEMARVLRPGAVLRGSAVITGAGRRQDALITLLRAAGTFGHPRGEAELREMLAGTGLRDVEVRASGGFAFFTAIRPNP
jgi:SAM-dependent methyltransferase